MKSADVVVLGAGPAGLSAAWRAARNGHQVVVLERAAQPGGMAASFEVAGMRVDHGSHRLHPSIDASILSELQRLLGGELQERPRNGRIRLAGRWIAFPLRATDLVRHLPPAFALGAARDAVLSPLRRGNDTFAGVIRASLGPTVAEEFYFPYARKLWGVEPDQLAAELARRRVGRRSAAAVLRRRSSTFLYPRRGFGSIVERLADAAVDAGAELRLGTEVTSLDAIDARHIFSTIPLGALASLAEPAPPANVLAAARRLEHRAVVLVYLVLRQRQYSPYDAHYFPGPETPVSRVSEPRNYRDGPDPPDRTVLCAEVPCAVGDDLWNADDVTLAGLVVDALADAPRPDAVEVRRLPRVYPVYRPGFEWDLAALELWAGALPGLVTFGRHGLFAHDNTHHALAMAWAAADSLRPDGGFDAAAWARARDGFRDHVVED